MTSTVALSAAAPAPAPQSIPIAATTQIVAADVNPWIPPRVWRIVPAPRKPTPVTICAARRAGSAVRVGALAAIVSDRSVMIVAPRQMRMFVRSPAGFPESSRSSPISPPSRVARRSLKNRSSRSVSAREANASMVGVC